MQNRHHKAGELRSLLQMLPTCWTAEEPLRISGNFIKSMSLTRICFKLCVKIIPAFVFELRIAKFLLSYFLYLF